MENSSTTLFVTESDVQNRTDAGFYQSRNCNEHASRTVGKTRRFRKTYPLIAHLLDTVTVAGALYDHWLRPGLRELIEENLGKQARSIVIAVMGLHDVGKANPLFQQRPQENGLEWQKIREIIDSSGNYKPIPPRHILLDRTKIDVRRHECSSAYTLQPSPPTEARAASKLWLHLVLEGITAVSSPF